MTTYLTQAMNGIAEAKIDKYWLEYFRESFRGEVNDQILEAFQSSGLTKADIARKLDRRPEQVTRWLAAPCNLEADTISDLALALGLMPKVRFEKVGEEQSNGRAHEFAIKMERTIEWGETERRRFIVEQSDFDTVNQVLSASTGRHRALTGSLSTKARVREVVNA